MHINTHLSRRDYLRAYRQMAVFFMQHPLQSALLIFLGCLVDSVPYALFPVKLALLALLVSFTASLIATQHINGSCREFLQELKLQQRIILPMLIAVVCLSWLGFVVADAIMLASQNPAIIQPGGLRVPQMPETVDGLTLIALSVLATGLGIAQIMPLVLAHFCRGLGLSKHQGEHIWMALLTKAGTFLAFFPIGQIAVIGLLLNTDTTVPLVLLASAYSTFMLFIVFGMKPKPQVSPQLNTVGSAA
ncbi:hypothetical protein DXV75_16010 [Alteromonas aestuariivivens]|uniref:Uncharacterized protein n=1 Tax=Alteromonas aestuariivivens TaxID=1938339 RepID=A0A3D8M366_9ALTE|nr:hypothetical protein [Alteromonas aestuariivivens]RDV24068.1 hypothetical protein DXV75_16010 [Alteromonas aestuariivivens]